MSLTLDKPNNRTDEAIETFETIGTSETIETTETMSSLFISMFLTALVVVLFLLQIAKEFFENLKFIRCRFRKKGCEHHALKK